MYLKISGNYRQMAITVRRKFVRLRLLYGKVVKYILVQHQKDKETIRKGVKLMIFIIVTFMLVTIFIYMINIIKKIYFFLR